MMIVLAALALLLLNVPFGRPCDGEGDVLICTNFPPYFSPGYSTLVMYLRDFGEINSTVFRSDALASVTRLRLDGAGVTGIAEGAFASLQNLTSLSLNDNALTRVNPDWLGRPAILNELSLAGNKIEVVSEFTLRGLIDLTKVSLNNNNIGTIGPNSFSSLTNLAELDLSDNRLTRIPSQVFRSFRSTRIRLHKNPWDCSCEAEDSVDSLKDLWSRSLLDTQMDVACGSPPPLKGTPVWNVSDVCATQTTQAPSSGTSSVRSKPTDTPATTSPSQPTAETKASVRPSPTDAVTTVALKTATATSSPLTKTSVYPKTSATTAAVSPSTHVTEPPSNTICTLTVVIAAGLCVLPFAVGFLAVLHTRKRNNKIATPGQSNEPGSKLEEGGGLGQNQLPGHSEKCEAERAGRSHFAGTRAKSANAVLSRSSFCVSWKEQVGLQKETEGQANDTGSPAEGKQEPVNEAQAEAGRVIQEESLSNPELAVKNKKRADLGKGLGENRHGAETVPYLSIGTNPDDATKQSTDSPGPRCLGAKVMGRISTWPPTAIQWQARCKLGEGEADVFAGWAQNEKFSSETKSKADRPDAEGPQKEDEKNPEDFQTAPSGDPPAMNEARMTLRNSESSSQDDEVTSVSEAYTRADVMLEEKRIQDLAAGRRTERENQNEEDLQSLGCKPAGNPAHKPASTSSNRAEQRREPKGAATGRQRGENRSTGSKAPSGGTSPDDDTLLSGNEYAFMDLLHEVVQNNGRWTRERWKQVHVNKQRR